MISGAAALFIILLVYFCYEIIPFGNKTIYRMDLYHQYGPLFSELFDRVTSGSSLIYSWTSGLGGSFLGNFYNYMSSPISFIILLFGHENTFEAIAAMIAIKAVLSAIAMSYYLKKSKGDNSLLISAFGVLYAFCGYFIAYYWNIMWTDSLYLLPFVVLGIERIIKTGRIRTYLIALVLTIFSNYYIGYMVCIFSCLYFIYYYCCSLSELKHSKKLLDNKGIINKIKNSFFIKSGIRFAFASASAGVILLFMLAPIAGILTSSSATAGNPPTDLKFYFGIFDFLVNHLASLEPTIRSSGTTVLPNIYCGILTVMLVPLYLFSKRISSTEKIASVVLLAIMYFSFNLNYLNFVWHGFHFPNDLPYRQSFMYSFLLLIMAYKALKNIDEFNKNHILTVGISLTAFIIIAEKLTSQNLNEGTVYVSIIFVFLFTIVLGLMTGKKAQAFALSVMLMCSVTAEMITASTDHYVANQTKESFAGDYEEFKDIQEKVNKLDDSVFYRTELSHIKARMDPCWYGYNGVSVFSSMAYEKVANLQKYIGMYGNLINSYTYNPQTPIYNSMFALKYVYDKSGYISDGDYYTLKTMNNKFKVYENNYALNIAYPVSADLAYWDASSYNNPIDAQNEYFRLATGVDNVVKRIYDYDITSANILEIDESSKISGMLPMNKISTEYPGSATVEITAENSENIYIYVSSRNLDTVNIYSSKLMNTMSVADGYILDLGKHTPGAKITVELPLKDSAEYASVDFSVFTIDKEKFIQGYEKLKSGQLEYTSFDDTVIKGTFTAENNEILYTSIPYDKSWNVYIDGKRVNDDIIKISDALLGIKVTAGTHKITFLYEPQGLKGAVIVSSVFTILLLILFILKEYKLIFFKKCKPNLWMRIEETNIKSNTANEIEKEIAENVEELLYTFDENKTKENSEKDNC